MTQPFSRFQHLGVVSILMASAALVLPGCNSRTTPTNPVAPSITSFSAAQASIAKGASTALSWQVSGSTPLTLSLDNGIGNVSGSSYAVSPAATTTYTLTATNTAGQVSKNLTITVTGGASNQAPTVSNTIAGKNVTQGAAAQTVDLKTIFNDAEDGTNLTFTASSSNSNVVSTSVSVGNLSLAFGSIGTAQVTVTAKDSGNLSVSTSFSVTVGSGGGTTCISGNFMNVQPYNNSLPNPSLTVTCTNTKASVATNAIPNHQSGSFPNANNPNSISAQNRTYPLSLSPTKAASITQQTLTLMGVAINGIGFEPFANEYYNNDSNSGWRYEALAYTMLGKGKNLGIDSSNAHVQPTGNYHYHGLPNGLVALLNKGTAMSIIGYIGDGFPVYAVYGYNNANDASSGTKEVKSSYRLKSGIRPSGPGGSYDGTFVQDYEYQAGLGDLDECNGRFGVTPEYPSGIYHYYITKTWPFIPRCFMGTPESYYVSAPK